METSQEHNFFNPTNQNSTNLASKQEMEDPIVRISSSSSSSCSSIEAEPKPDETLNSNNYVEQSPPTQVMERSTNNTTTTTTSSPNTTSYRIPSRVFARTTSTAPVEWSTLSNESLFSIHMGNNSFTGGDYFKSGELTFPQPPSPITPPLPSPLPSPHQETNQGGSRVVEEAKTPVDIGKKAAETDKAYRASKEEEQKAAASIREVIMANEAAKKENNNNNNKTNKLDRSVSRRSEDVSVKSFAFPILGNADKGGLQGSAPQKKQRRPSQPETPKISTEAEGDERLKKEEAPKSVTPKEADHASNCNPRWLSCFPCCTTFCV
ncbi:hypothetical protein EUTSA_v10018880mg [Eutrema salsugineum]|uniref:Uncharacterized protein n=1 Tax=Eutrema salsugineum TaxID=72664 RepID=V4KKE3_EUTSA|nr:ankyrin repeat, bromo and BTB domain-containing protein DDB_G0293800 [Eutrema salsugineum]ESQ27733.1 hypothetical protein EUTSA_v10018880mg [Eutrema salsugineum]